MASFLDRLRRPGLQAIAEIKRRSPSAGELRPDADPAAGGPPSARFFRREEQLRELAEAGASAVLLLVRDLGDERLRTLQALARDLGMDALVEAHGPEELDRAIALGADPVGINCRDLASFEIDRRAQLALVATAPRDRVVIAESGVRSRAQGAAAELAGAGAILVGSALMRAADPAAALAELIARPLVKICGLTRPDDVTAAAEAGADMAGFILARESPRRIDEPLPVPETMLSVSVFVGERRDADTDLVQLYGREDGHRARDAVLLRGEEVVARVIDLPWLEEDPGHLDRARAIRGRVMLAGRLAPDNVAAAIARVRPWAVDAASSLELEPGVKDHARLRAFVEAARAGGVPA
jgi:indole-3-glycerol phosphate synthase/phosphoribosylanthranilate isomerase